MPQPGLSDVDICSLALRMIGSKPIQSFADTTPQAGLMSALYPLARDVVMRSYRWKFTIKRVQLNLITTTVYPFKQTRLELPTGLYVYALPNDYLSMVETDQDPSPYKMESVVTNTTTNAQQLVIISDNPTLGIRYVSRVTDPSLFDSHFVNALVSYLAKEVALPETGDKEKWKMLEQIYIGKIAEARFQGSIEDSTDTLVATYFTTDVR
jgi:hypothetical protein